MLFARTKLTISICIRKILIALVCRYSRYIIADAIFTRAGKYPMYYCKMLFARAMQLFKKITDSVNNEKTFFQIQIQILR